MNLSFLRTSILGLVWLVSVAPPCSARETSPDREASPGVASSTELSVAPLDHIDYPLDRPHWIDDTGDTVEAGHDDTVLIAVTSGPSPSPAAALEAMEVMARGAVENYVEHLSRGFSERIDADEIKVDMDWIRDELIARHYEGTVQTGETLQYESACLLQIGKTQQQTLEQLIQNQRLKHRLAAVGILGLLSLLALLGGSVVFGWASAPRKNAAAQRARA